MPKKLKREELEELVVQTRLKPAEVRALYARFRRLAPTGYLLPEQFKQTMGVLGLTDDPFLPDRMFQVFDGNQDGKLSFFEFASSLAVMIRGTEDEKLKLSFEMAAGHRGASGITLEDFQRLVNACNTMMSSLVEPQRYSSSNEDVTRLFHDMASGGSSGEEGEAVITLDAYKNAVQNSDDFLVCLGLEPHPRRRTRRSMSPTSLTPATPQLRAEGQVVVSAAQIEDLRSRVSALRRAAERHRLRSVGLRETRTPPAATTPPSAEDSDERWWMPTCGCTPLERTSDDPLPRERAASRVQGRQNPFDEVCEELDGIIGWCASCSEPAAHSAAAEGGAAAPTAQPHSASGAASSRAPAAVAASREAPSAASRTSSKEISRDMSRELAVESISRPNVHARPAHPRSSTSAASGSAQGGGAYGRGRSSALVSNASTSRQRRRHRLLGPKKGLAVHFGHENWNMVLSMMIGIRMSVGRCKGEITRELLPVDFIMKEKFTIIPRLANIFDSTVSKRVTMTRFMDYAPMVFQRIRSSFGIAQDDYLRSVGPDQLLGNMVLGNLASLSELSSEGKSGAFFYYTADGKYMMKTVNNKEHKLLKKMLKRYYDHIMQNPGTLIVRFLGLHSLRVHKERRRGSLRHASRKLYFVVMGNMFNTPFDIHRRYDLKGSWVGRTTPSDRFDPSVALKDVDFKQANETIRVGEEYRTRLLAQIESDSGFLRDQNIIDYSLLLGIHEMGTIAVPAASGPGGDDTASETASEKGADRQTGDVVTERPSVTESALLGSPGGTGATQGRPGSPVSGALGSVSSAAAAPSAREHPGMERTEVPVHQRDSGGLLSSDRKSLYFFGIIDILTPYDSIKKMEHNLKAMRYDSRGVSCCPPGLYADRFNEFMRRAFA